MVKTTNLIYEYNSNFEENESANLPDEPETALKGIDVSIEKGEFVAVLGRNGSGKSTFAKLINAIFTPTDGEIWVNGIDTRISERVWDIRKNVGMVFQNPDNQIIASVVEEDVAFGPENLGVPSEEIRKRVDSALKAVGMSEYAVHAPHFLSGGQKQRVAIAGVLAMSPNCIVLDEPTAMLDPSGRKDVIDTVIRLNREQGITAILITHYMDEAVKADRVIVMNGGKVAIEGTPREVFKNSAELKKIGLDVPQAAEIAQKLTERGFDLPDGILTVDELVVAVRDNIR